MIYRIRNKRYGDLHEGVQTFNVSEDGYLYYFSTCVSKDYNIELGLRTKDYGTLYEGDVIFTDGYQYVLLFNGIRFLLVNSYLEEYDIGKII